MAEEEKDIQAESPDAVAPDGAGTASGSDGDETAAAAEASPAADEQRAQEPVAEPEAETEPEVTADADAAEEAPAAPAPEKRKRKRLPRTLRPTKTRPKRQPSTGRKPIVRLPKPETMPGRRQERRGVVVSDAMDKTIVVKVEVIRTHPRYKKVIRRSVKFHAHDEQNRAKIGDVVRIVETRPLSKTKHWRLAEVVEEAK